MSSDETKNRRNFIKAAGLIPLSLYSGSKAFAFENKSGTTHKSKEQFRETVNFHGLEFIRTDTKYFNAGSVHPLSLGANKEVIQYYNSRANLISHDEYKFDSKLALSLFAKLTNVELNELAYVQSTTAAEQMVIKALGIPANKGTIVSDTLHFFGSLPMYEELSKQGMNVVWVKDKDGKIDLAEFIKHITKDTKLVSVSLVSTVNGFQHDLKAICDAAHEVGAFVYADIIHAAGCVPVDLHASGVDFAACSSYKWLMGDFGLGFLYVKNSVQSQLKRTNYGYYALTKFESHIYPYDTPGNQVVDYAFAEDANGHFALGTRQHSVIAQLNYSLKMLNEIGVDRIQNHAQSLVTYVKQELAKMGFQIFTPIEAQTPFVTCVYKNARERLKDYFKTHNISASLHKHSFRFTFSVFNDENEVNFLLAKLKDIDPR